MSNELLDTPKKNPWPWIGGGIAIAAIAVGAFVLAPKGEDKPKPRKVDNIVVTLAPPPPLPPPPKPKEEPPKQEEVKQEMVKQEAIEDTPPPQAEPEPAPALSTNLEGPGNDSFGLAHGTGKGAVGSGGTGIGGNGGRRSGKYDAYAGQTQSAVRDALGRDPKTRTATFSGTFRVWVDATGRVTRAKGADGNATAVLNGLQMPSAPPSDMPMPIVMRISASKPATAAR